MYSIGDVVAFRSDGTRQIGEIVGLLSVPGGPLYDVSLEAIVVKAVEEDDLDRVHPDEVRALLTAMVGRSLPMSTRGMRLLHQRYAAFLTTALDRLEREQKGLQPDASARFEIGQTVVAREDDALSLGVVSMVIRAGEGICYEVDVMGETLRLGESSLEEISAIGDGTELCLGGRARFVAEGYEGDDAFMGTICRVEGQGDEREYSLMFDDGDILEGLTAVDLEQR